MASVETPRGTFGSKLKAELVSRNMGARTLARAISQEHGGSIEDRRRAVIRWLRGGTPVEMNRHIVEDVLGVPRDSLKGDDEDEDESSMSLDEFLRLRIRRILREEVYA